MVTARRGHRQSLVRLSGGLRCSGVDRRCGPAGGWVADEEETATRELRGDGGAGAASRAAQLTLSAGRLVVGSGWQVAQFGPRSGSVKSATSVFKTAFIQLRNDLSVAKTPNGAMHPAHRLVGARLSREVRSTTRHWCQLESMGPGAGLIVGLTGCACCEGAAKEGE